MVIRRVRVGCLGGISEQLDTIECINVVSFFNKDASNRNLQLSLETK